MKYGYFKMSVVYIEYVIDTNTDTIVARHILENSKSMSDFKNSKTYVKVQKITCPTWSHALSKKHRSSFDIRKILC